MLHEHCNHILIVYLCCVRLQIVHTLVQKLGDGQARLRDAGMDALLSIARCRVAGCSFIANAALKVRIAASIVPKFIY